MKSLESRFIIKNTNIINDNRYKYPNDKPIGQVLSAMQNIIHHEGKWQQASKKKKKKKTWERELKVYHEGEKMLHIMDQVWITLSIQSVHSLVKSPDPFFFSSTKNTKTQQSNNTERLGKYQIKNHIIWGSYSIQI